MEQNSLLSSYNNFLHRPTGYVGFVRALNSRTAYNDLNACKIDYDE